MVVEGPYQWVRHPIYLSHFLLIGGSALACGALKVYLETPIVLGMAAIGGYGASLYNDLRLHLDLRAGDHPSVSRDTVDL